jgi:electron transport complex protein RnfD
MVFRIASSPYTHNNKSTNAIMLWVILACIPGIAAQCYFFGYGNLIQIILAAIVAYLAEGIAVKLRGRSVNTTLKDNSALLTAVLLGICIPAYAPWWVITIGTLFAIVIAKQLYGGLGQNPFNPAMVGYVVLLVSFPVQMTSWPLPLSLQSTPLSLADSFSLIFNGVTVAGDSFIYAMSGIDGITQATPLDKLKTTLAAGQLTASQILQQPIYGVIGGIGWEWVNAGFLLGGVLLLGRRIIQWQIPVSFLATLLLCTAIHHAYTPEATASPLFHLFSGATMLGAFFIATDPVTAATTPKGRLMFGALIGFLVWLIRAHGGYPDAVAFAVLLANITVPLIDHYTQPRVYGHQ